MIDAPAVETGEDVEEIRITADNAEVLKNLINNS